MTHSKESTAENPYALQPAQLVWSEDGLPSAEDYDDVYFSRDNGLEESRYVFLQHNQLEQRWRNLDPAKPGRFTLVETGFGSGLNFLLCWQLWLQSAPESWQLQYLSFEKHPMRGEDLARSQAYWSELAPLAGILQQNYPPLIPGQHRRWLSSNASRHRVCLNLVFGDLHDTLPELLDSDWALINKDTLNKDIHNKDTHLPALNRPVVDAWLLDGFAPAKNPGMWQEPLFSCMNLLSGEHTTFATFTSAGIVKRGLKSAGFKVEKVKGYGRKREMLCGKWQPDYALTEPPAIPSPALPWHQPSSHGEIKHIAIIGAGLAGCSTAAALAQRGYRVTVIERHSQTATEASGNPQGILYTKLSPDPGALNHFTLSSFLYSLNYYRELLENNSSIEGELCGVLQLAANEKEALNFELLGQQLAGQHWLNLLPAESDALKNLGLRPFNRPAHFYPDAGWLNPASLCAHWLNHPNIELCTQTEALAITLGNTNWKISGAHDFQLDADAVVICNANDAKAFNQSAYLPTRAIRGQLSYIPADTLPSPLKTVICHEGYIAPAQGGQYCIGASFDLKNTHTELNDKDHQWNLEQLRALIPELAEKDIPILGGRAALRCASPDYLPIVGALPNIDEVDQSYAPLRKDARKHIAETPANLPNLFINIAHGSRGLTSTPLCAELVASYIAGELRPLPRSLCEHLAPTRFLIRDLMRNRR
ncbi:bifunctional tRNA (5-methylaminomethyl-2-thiouridine)(34)-methyltransferase MnmD/FAD-dependent 5-carboxymethylaminomethyl-2-thiouridine(34) oxidoreductase MnmC [Spongiibacter sp. KMU-158]|uniref:tRNA 5-methylaminomethyl-2-thiouridine biosynthesis bifunctional protein MnmC n=1 Tax=Spongiibacter pelagi TaxID=2760804 RepID=A0A927C2B0_9GAMM|nr:bifunctional tRNA (5-methylaminomethyl-2-thiouridine)(34)-methyltransferase MnmD/FAD-dependent 5-carboxymethylaminomethyl-2-thiouridine(34) oxidoreductase MnmC [Spongiibacter pelagi]MBD2858486.1 bifunctional tRNA (5-methylaminomethyl-2-thiouridine)(34)-methyltransferase MnmD/FAD-dependent 5-carboxymethylaminomethyl-2-thiouridine(34) oxidoreductase MnmC [Spongiibacter pelagi]